MAKAAKKAAPAKSTESTTPAEAAPKKMTKAEAEEIAKQYVGINGASVPENVQQARNLLKGE
jgi:hypothetical protein